MDEGIGTWPNFLTEFQGCVLCLNFILHGLVDRYCLLCHIQGVPVIISLILREAIKKILKWIFIAEYFVHVQMLLLFGSDVATLFRRNVERFAVRRRSENVRAPN